MPRFKKLQGKKHRWTKIRWGKARLGRYKFYLRSGENCGIAGYCATLITSFSS